MDEHRGQELAELQKCQYATELTTPEPRYFFKILSNFNINYLREILLSAEWKKFDKIIIYLDIAFFFESKWGKRKWESSMKDKHSANIYLIIFSTSRKVEKDSWLN